MADKDNLCTVFLFHNIFIRMSTNELMTEDVEIELPKRSFIIQTHINTSPFISCDSYEYGNGLFFYRIGEYQGCFPIELLIHCKPTP